MKKQLTEKQQVVVRALRNIWIIVYCAALYSAGTYFFIYPNNFAPGGVAGIVAMIEHFVGVEKASYFLLILNIPLLILSAIYLSRGFSVRTLASIVLMSLFLNLCGRLNLPQYSAYVNVTLDGVDVVYRDYGLSIIAAVFGGVISGITVGKMLLIQCSQGGVDIIAAIMQKRDPQYNISFLIFILNAVVVVLSLFVYAFNVETDRFEISVNSLQPVLLSLIYTYVSSKMSDVIIQGNKTALKFEVITDKPDELAAELIEKLHHGVTVLPAKGMYMHSEKNLLICIIRKRKVAEFRRILKRYPDSFTYAASVSEVIGKFLD